MAAYDDFAWFYHRYWNEEFHSLAFPVLERIWLPQVPAKGRVLDVCCGTGYLAGLLAHRGYRLTGVDASAEMIAHAREHAPAAEFLVGEAAAFQVRGKFDAAVSTFDSINHLLRVEELEGSLRCVAAALKPGAAFVFDALTEGGYRTDWAEGFSIVRKDHVLIISGSGYDARTRMARCTITMFRLVDGAWRRADTEMRERCHSREEIDRALEKAGFEAPVCYDARDLGMGGQLGQGRVFWVTRRRHSRES